MSLKAFWIRPWSLKPYLRRRIDIFSTRSLHRITRYHWDDFLTHHRVLRGTKSRPITYMGLTLRLAFCDPRWVGEATPSFLPAYAPYECLIDLMQKECTDLQLNW